MNTQELNGQSASKSTRRLVYEEIKDKGDNLRRYTII